MARNSFLRTDSQEAFLLHQDGSHCALKPRGTTKDGKLRMKKVENL